YSMLLVQISPMGETAEAPKAEVEPQRAETQRAEPPKPPAAPPKAEARRQGVQKVEDPMAPADATEDRSFNKARTLSSGMGVDRKSPGGNGGGGGGGAGASSPAPRGW